MPHRVINPNQGQAGVDDVIWRWNETDLDEFTGGTPGQTSGLAPNLADGFGGTTSLARAIGVWGQPVLRMTNTAGGSARACWSVKASALFKPFPTSGRWIIEYYAERANPTNNNDGFRPGIMVLCDEVDQGIGVQVRQLTNNAGVNIRCVAGVAVDDLTTLPQISRIGTNTGGRQGSWIRHEIFWTVATPFFINIKHASDSLDGGGTSGGISDVGVVGDFGLPAAFDSWQPTTLGIFLRGVTATANDMVDISSIVVRQSPMDVTLP